MEAQQGLLEWIILGGIFALQCYFAIIIYSKIALMKGIFKTLAIVKKDDDDSEPEIYYEGSNKIMSSICSTINNYLGKNAGGVVDFYILKDIVDRNVDALEEEIANKISAPLYLGLAGTMVGIIIGLMFIDFSDNNDLKITPLIDGIKYAMIVSVVGLGITIVLSVGVFRVAKSKVNYGRNEFLSILQTELLPSLIQSEDAATRELSLQLDHFSRQTPEYISSLSENTNLIKSSIESEIQVLEEVKNLDIKKMSSANASIFKELSGLMDQFAAFPRYYKKLNASLSNTIQLNNNLHNLVSSTNDVSKILDEVKQIIETSSEATTFFNAHIQSFEKYGGSVETAMAKADQRFETALLQLQEAVQKQYEVFSQAITDYDTKLSNAFDHSIKKFNEAFENAVPEFSKLKFLESINEHTNVLTALNETAESLKSQSAEQNVLLRRQNELLSDLEINVPSQLDFQLQEKEKTNFEKFQEILVVSTCVIVIGFVLYVTVLVSL